MRVLEDDFEATMDVRIFGTDALAERLIIVVGLTEVDVALGMVVRIISDGLGDPFQREHGTTIGGDAFGR